MPFGIPATPEDNLDTIALGLGDNTTDLSQFGSGVMGAAQTVINANARDTTKVLNAVTQRISKATAANAVDLSNVSQPMALGIASGIQANAADLSTSGITLPSGVIGSSLSSASNQSQIQGNAQFYFDVDAAGCPRTSWDTASNPSTQITQGTIGPFTTAAARDAAMAAASAKFCGSASANMPSATSGFTGVGSGLIGGSGTQQTPTSPITPSGGNAGGTSPGVIGGTLSGGTSGTIGGTTPPTNANYNYYWSCFDIPNNHPIQWVISYGQGQDGGVFYLVVFDTNQFTPVAGTTIFATSPDAYLWLSDPTNESTLACQQTQGEIPPTEPATPITGGTNQPTPTPVTPPTQLQAACPALPTCFANGIGLPGTIEFCQCLQQLPAEFQQFVGYITGVIQNTISVDAVSKILDMYQNTGSLTNPAGYILDALVAAAKLLIYKAGDSLQIALNTLRCALTIAGSINSAGDGGLFVALITLKWILALLKEWEIGTDALAWIIDRIELTFGPLEDLLDRLIKWSLPVEIPGPGEVTHAWLQGQIPDTIRDCVWQMHGLNPAMYINFAMAESEALSPDEIIEIGVRRKMDANDIETQLINHGWVRQWDTQAKMDLFWEIPTIGDHLHWLSRNVDDAGYVQQYGLLDGFAPVAEIQALGPWPNYQNVTDPHGRNFWGTYGDDLTSQGMRQVNAAFHYAAHWIQPSPEQMKEFIYRLRPGAPDMPVQFTLQDLDRILAEQDYAPLARQWFVATAYQVPALSYIVGMYRQNVIDETRLAQYHMDLGYTEQDSNNFVGVDRVFKAQYRTTRFAGWTASAIAKAVALDAMTEDEARNRMAELGSTNDEATDAFNAARVKLAQQITTRARSRALSRTVTRITKGLQAGILADADAQNQLQAIGFPQGYAIQIVLAESAAANSAIVLKQTQAIRQQYLDGFIDQPTAQAALQSIGIVDYKVTQFISLWNLQNGPRRKHRTAKEIVNDVVNGYYDTSTALMRLQNLGYDNADSMLYIADASSAISQRNAKAAAAAQKSSAAAAKAQMALAKQARQQAKQLQSAARSTAPRGTLVKWLRQGLINSAEFSQRMVAQGYSTTDATRYVSSAVKDVTQTILEAWQKDKVINAPYYQYRLLQLGYTAADVARFQQDFNTKNPPPPQTP